MRREHTACMHVGFHFMSLQTAQKHEASPTSKAILRCPWHMYKISTAMVSYCRQRGAGNADNRAPAAAVAVETKGGYGDRSGGTSPTRVASGPYSPSSEDCSSSFVQPSDGVPERRPADGVPGDGHSDCSSCATISQGIYPWG